MYVVDAKAHPRKTMPVLFELLSPPGNFPRQIMTPILDKLKEKALAPFREDIPVDTGTTVVRGEDTLSFFASLPRIRNRRCYEADADKKSKVQLCTKGYNAHPSLTPGIFTIFCPHGQFLFCIIIIHNAHVIMLQEYVV